MSGRPPCWICHDVTILHPVIDFHAPNTVLYFHVDWFGSFRRPTSLTYLRLVTDRQTDRQKTDRNRHRLKPRPPSRLRGTIRAPSRSRNPLRRRSSRDDGLAYRTLTSVPTALGYCMKVR